jgi:Ca2+-transporting ATPase
MNKPFFDIHHGLDDEQVQRSRKEYGANSLTPPPREPWWKLLLEKFDDPTIRILLVAAVISVLLTMLEVFVLHHKEASFIDSIGIILAVALATLAGFFSEMKSSREFDLLNKVKDDIPVKVLRNGQVAKISINDLVVGDVVQLALGDKVPADGVVFDALGLLIDQSVMTGESVPVEVVASGEWRAVSGELEVGSGETETDLLTADHSPLTTIYRGTMVADGHGQFIVTKVGDQTRLGQIAAHLGSTESDSNTPLTQKLTVLAKQISTVGITSAVLIFMVMASFTFWNWNGDVLTLIRSLLTCFVVAVTIIVVAVPEGLPMMVTVSLALNMMKMAKENCLIRKLVASETIGSATVICSDKTGTLTQNRMTVVRLIIGLKEYGEEDIETIKQLPEWTQMIDSISVNSEADLHIDTSITDIGNPTECALLRLLHNAGTDYRLYREKFPRLFELSHNSQRKMSLVVVERNATKICYAKGASEKLIDCCSSVFVNGEKQPIDGHRETILSALNKATENALRVIAFTVSDCCGLEERCYETCQDQTLLALIGIADPIRNEVPHAVEVCHAAGVDVKMITGDAEPTAVAIAKQAGILSAEKGGYCPRLVNDIVLTSEKLAALSDDELVEMIPRLKVLARSTPMDKLRLVKAMHQQGEVVAMTGDGTNDAPALKFADVGISMGIAGTEVAKEASDIVLIDDNFKSIVTGIWWGRTLYQNIQKFLQFQLSVNFVALTCALLGPLVGVPLPLTVPQLLWINIIMDTFAAIALSTDPPRSSSMMQKPVSRNASIITPQMMFSITLIGLYQVIILALALYGGWFLEEESAFQFHTEPRDPVNLEALTVFFTIFVSFQFWNIFNCRSLRSEESPFALLHKNKLFLLIVSLIAVVQVGAVQGSNYFYIGQIFRTEPLSLIQWIKIVLLTATVIPFAWLMRLFVPVTTTRKRH